MKNASNTAKHYTMDAGLLRERLTQDTVRAIRRGGVSFEESMRLSRLEKHLARLIKQPSAKVHETIVADAELICEEELS